MAPFHFRLEQVLAYRKRLEEEAMQALAEAVMRRDALLERIEAIKKDQAAQRERLASPAGMEAGERWVLQSYMDGLKLDLKRAVERLALAEEEVDRCRVELVEKAQERSLLDTLKEKQAAKHAMLERQKEQREFDEIATLRFKPATF